MGTANDATDRRTLTDGGPSCYAADSIFFREKTNPLRLVQFFQTPTAVTEKSKLHAEDGKERTKNRRGKGSRWWPERLPVRTRLLDPRPHGDR